MRQNNLKLNLTDLKGLLGLRNTIKMKLFFKITLASLILTSFINKKEYKHDGKYIMIFKNANLKNFTHIYFKNDSCIYYNDYFIMCKKAVFLWEFNKF